VAESFAGDAVRPEPFEFEAEAVRYEYGEVAALEELSLQVRAGERIALLGANGSGKSTLLRLMDGLHFACGGTLRFRGAALTCAAMEDDEFAMGFRRRVGLVFQNPDIQLFNPTVFDEVAFGPLQMGWPREKILERVYSVLQWIGAEHLKDRAPYRLSGGEKKRVAIASVIVLDPDVLLLDEPTAMLDPKSQSQVIELLEGWGDRAENRGAANRVAENQGRKTIITATHQLEMLPEICGRAVVLENGAVVADGAPAEVLGDTALLESANLIHSHRHLHGGVAHRHLSPFLRHEHHKP
jgi:cobalt/nickel transport system ATP-binding protein